MDRQQLESLKEVEDLGRAIHLSAQDYGGKTSDPKTLLYGYDTDRNTWHVFQDFGGFIYLYVYRDFGSELTGSRRIDDAKKVDVSGDGIKDLQELIPNKRLYPQYCDFIFCAYLKERGVNLPFTTYEEPRTGSTTNPKSCFAGEIY